MSSRIIIGLAPSEKIAKSVARLKNCNYMTLEINKFPDGELYIRFPRSVKGKETIVVQSLVDPNEKIIELLFICNTAKELGAKKIVLVAPYMAYMRADRRFQKGEVISANILARVLSSCFDKVITIDPHLHRIKKLSEIFTIKSKRLTCVELIADYIRKHSKKPVIVGPDEESYQWANSVAKFLNTKAFVLKKRRKSSREVEVKTTSLNLDGQEVFIVDDIISTGHTMIETIKGVKNTGARNIHCIGVHGLFVENADKKIIKAGARKITTTNTIPNKYSEIDVTNLVSNNIK